MKSLYEPNVGLIGKVMDMQLQRQNVIMSNIANINTPRYKTRSLEFEAELQRELDLDSHGKVARTNPQHIPNVFNAETFEAQLDISTKPRVAHGEDRVNLEKEMAKMTKNSLHYNALTQVIKGSFDGVRNILTEGTKV